MPNSNIDLSASNRSILSLKVCFTGQRAAKLFKKCYFSKRSLAKLVLLLGVLRSLTFEESVRRNGKEGQLEQGFAEDESLEPLWSVHHHRVPEVLRVPPQNISQLEGGNTQHANFPGSFGTSDSTLVLL